VSSAELERLVGERSVIREPFDDAQVVGYWSKAVASFRSAQAKGLASDNAFQVAYTAGLQATLAVLAAHGLRVRSAANHYTAFHAAQNLSATLRDHARRLDALRSARHQSMYEPDHDEEEMMRRVARAIATLRDALPAIRAEIIGVRPAVSQLLVPLD
jgi:hypothetical protein